MVIMQIKTLIMDEQAMNRAIARITFEIIERNKGISSLCLLGVHRKGVIIAQRVKEKILELEQKEIDVGIIDTASFRDDLAGKELPIRNFTAVNFDITDRKVILVDDVISTGRTIRAAIDAIMSLGRPKNIQLAVLIDRGHRELPIRPDFVGKNVPTSNSETVKVLLNEYDNENKVVIV
jgi:pyrimidine operon attenuation protein/uracil phosphoribosyltransferase